MILMWLGSFVLMMWGLSSFQKNLAFCFFGIQKAILHKGVAKKSSGLFLQALSLVILEASPLRALYSGMGLFNLRVLSVRPAVLMMCLSPLALIPVILLGSLFLNFSGFFILGLCVVTLLRFGKRTVLDDALKVLFSVGVFLVGAESLLRNSSILQTYLTQNEWAFFLADGRFGTVVVLILVTLVLSFVIQAEFWTLALALSLLTSGVISFNGALGMVLGERLAMAALFWYRTRGLNQECQRVGQQYAVLSFLSAGIGFWLAGEARVWWGGGFLANLSAVQEKIFLFLMLFALMLGTQWVLGMVWGHFAGNSGAEELQDPKYFSSEWLERGLFSEGMRSWAKDKVQQRLSEIRYHIAGLQTLKENQVPPPIQLRLQEEERQLSQLGL